ncbi:MAG TPA: dTMP kinase [Lacipirellulaceae bacterium]|jgi:dTMP kinase|nr:dTMP kinase [Lacipirellulaceae bacterium]
MFFSFDGIDGVGKSTQVALLADALNDRKFEVIVCRDPGSTPLGERVREILLSKEEGTPIGRCSEMLLYMAARAALVEQVIQPALAAGKVVIADRYLLANVVYQGHAGGLDPQEIWDVGRVATRGLMPECIFLLDMAPGSAGNRIDRPLDRMESQGDDFRERLRIGFLQEATGRERIHIIAADRPIDEVQADIWRIAAETLRI